MIETICALVLSGATTVLPTDCAADLGSRYHIIPIITPPKPKPKLDPRRHSKPSPLSRNMVTIRTGDFMMGSPASETRRDPNEGPQVRVSIPYKFEIGKYEVTWNDWMRCVAAGGCGGYVPKDGGWGKGPRPVINISYNDAQNYVRWLNRRTGLRYRLPTEAEWEYVAREGKNQIFSFGDSISASQANFNGEHPYGPSGVKGAYLRKTRPVGSYAANSFGVYDIHGNVYEWVSDCYAATHAGRPATSISHVGGDCKFRVMRGGSWVAHGYQLRAAKRLRYVKDYRYDDYGFRIARTLE